MTPGSMPFTANHVSNVAPTRKRNPKRRYSCALAVLLGLAAIPLSTQGQTLSVLYSFRQGDISNPASSLILDPEGNLYGTTVYGGDLACNTPFGCGTIYKLDATGKRTVLHSFTGKTDGGLPAGALIRDEAGNLFGTTQVGGDVSKIPNGGGVVFKLTATNEETALHSFTGTPDADLPSAGLIHDAKGNLYSTTVGGGKYGWGAVFRVSSTGKETVLFSFAGGAAGQGPFAGVVRDAAGNFFGTTSYGGVFNMGTVFEVDMAGKQTVLHSFTGGPDGGLPFAGLAADGEDLYGTTENGGTFGNGTVYKVDKEGKVSVVHSFTGGADGATPFAGLTHDASGSLYGTTANGGAFGGGTVFKMDTAGNETVLHSFTYYGADGGVPVSSVALDAAGNIYGTTENGGAFGFGTVFKITP